MFIEASHAAGMNWRSITLYMVEKNGRLANIQVYISMVRMQS